MPTIRLTDGVGLVVDAELRDDGGLATWLAELRELRLPDRVLELLEVPLASLPDDVAALGVGLDVEQPVTIGAGAELSVGGGTSLHLRFVDEGDGPLLQADAFGQVVEVGPGERWATVTLTARVQPGVVVGTPLTFGVEAGREISFTTYRRLDDEGAAGDETGARLVDGLRAGLDAFTIPVRVADLAAMPAGTVATVSGVGRLSFSTEAELLALANPLVGASLPGPVPDLELTAGGSVRVGADFAISGEHQVRVRRADDGNVHLSIHRKQGERFGARATLAAGLAAGLGDFELTEKVLGALGGDSDEAREARRQELLRAGLPGERIAAIDTAVQGALERSLELAVRLEYGVSSEEGAAFELEVDPALLDDAGTGIVEAALRGELAPVTRAADEGLPAGITLRRSLATRLRERRPTLRVNLLGVFNVGSVARLALEGRVLYDRDSGDLVVTDEATAERLSTSFQNLFVEDVERLRAVLAERFLLTAAYRGTALAAGRPELTSIHSHFERHSATAFQTLKDHLDVVQALDLLSEADKQTLLAGKGDVGSSTLLAETVHDAASLRALFLDDHGKPRPRTFYEDAGRQALGVLVQRGDPDARFRRLVLDDHEWRRMKAAGQPRFATLYPGLARHELLLLAGDYTAIAWWSDTMARAAEAVHRVEELFEDDAGPANGAMSSAEGDASPTARGPSPGGDEPSPAAGAAPPAADDPRLEERRAVLAELLAEIGSRVHERFGDPWGLVSMDIASGREARASVRIESPVLSLDLHRE